MDRRIVDRVSLGRKSNRHLDKPAGPPVEHVTKVELVVNLKTARERYFRFGSRLCENAMARSSDRIDHLSDCEFCRDDSCTQPFLTDLRKIILRVFAFPEFSHSLDRNANYPPAA
jgi:hypothetical protein